MEKIKTGYRDFIIGETSIYKFLLITFIEFQFVFIIYFIFFNLLGFEIFTEHLGLHYSIQESLGILCSALVIIYFISPIFYKGKNKFLSINIIKDGIVASRKHKVLYITIKLVTIMLFFY